MTRMKLFSPVCIQGRIYVGMHSCRILLERPVGKIQYLGYGLNLGEYLMVIV